VAINTKRGGRVGARDRKRTVGEKGLLKKNFRWRIKKKLKVSSIVRGFERRRLKKREKTGNKHKIGAPDGTLPFGIRVSLTIYISGGV